MTTTPELAELDALPAPLRAPIILDARAWPAGLVRVSGDDAAAIQPAAFTEMARALTYARETFPGRVLTILPPALDAHRADLTGPELDALDRLDFAELAR